MQQPVLKLEQAEKGEDRHEAGHGELQAGHRDAHPVGRRGQHDQQRQREEHPRRKGLPARELR